MDSGFGYKFLAREMERQRRNNTPREAPSQAPPRVDSTPVDNYYANTPIRPRVQGPQQVQGVLDAGGTGSTAYSDRNQFFRNSLLPQVYELLGPEGVARSYGESLGRETAQRVRERRAAQQVPRTEELRYRPTAQIDDTFYADNYEYRQRPIPGLNQQIHALNKNQRALQNQRSFEALDSFLERYPEVIPLLENDTIVNQGVRARRVKGKEFGPYMQYADLDQQYSDPEARGAIYRGILDAQDTEPRLINYAYAEGKPLSTVLQNVEDLYTSGDAYAQGRARDVLADLGRLDQLQAIEQPSFQQTRPVIGGGSYVPLADSADAQYINQRAYEFEKAINPLLSDVDAYQALQERFPALKRKESYSPGRTYFIDEDGDVNYEEGVNNYDIDDGYAIKPARGNRRSALMDMNSIPGYAPDKGAVEVSRNALAFLRDYPAFAERSVAFTAGEPGREPSYDYVNIPQELQLPISSYVMSEVTRDQRPGQMLFNSPAGNYDIFGDLRNRGLDADTSSYIRKAEPFLERGQEPPNIRAQAYASSGFGPLGRKGELMYTYVDQQGRLVPIQFERPERPLVGENRVFGFDDGSSGVQSYPAATYRSQPRYYTNFLPGLTQQSLIDLAQNIKRTPSSLLPGAADAIPSKEAVNRLYQEGPTEAGKQLLTDFLVGLPLSAGLAPILSSPAAAPFAPGVGGGLLGVAGVEAADALTRQQTGKGLLQRVRETAGAISGDRSLVGTDRGRINPDSEPGRAMLEREMARVDNPPEINAIDPQDIQQQPQSENFLEQRLRLAKEARQSDPYDFGITELLFGR